MGSAVCSLPLGCSLNPERPHMSGIFFFVGSSHLRVTTAALDWRHCNGASMRARRQIGNSERAGTALTIWSTMNSHDRGRSVTRTCLEGGKNIWQEMPPQGPALSVRQDPGPQVLLMLPKFSILLPDGSTESTRTATKLALSPPPPDCQVPIPKSLALPHFALPLGRKL